MKRPLLLMLVGTFALVVAGCGDQTAVTVYKQGQYQGKPDMEPWGNDTFKGDKLAWERAIKARNERQDETSRGTPTAAIK